MTALPLRSPTTGEALVPEGELLRDADGVLWPVIDGIAYLRTGREALVREAAEQLDAGDRDGALALLLRDQDDWWTGALPEPDALRELIGNRDRLTLRAAMDLLCYDRVGHYFAHRWSDPTFLSGLALIDANWRPATTSFELACGIGHFGRELLRRGVGYTGADVVFGKLWLARHFVLPPAARLVCMDAATPWPLGVDERFDLVLCHDAFYFLEPKNEILARLRGLRVDGGRLCVGHVHNSEAANLSAGRSISAAEMRALFPEATSFDDGELARAATEARAPVPEPFERIADVNAFSVEDEPGVVPQGRETGFVVPLEGARLRLNPLYAETDGALSIQWPSERYRSEYGPDAPYPERLDGSARERAEGSAHHVEDVRRRVLVDLPERW